MFGRYHVHEPRRFYDGSATWLVSPDPGSGPVGSETLRRAARRSTGTVAADAAAAGGDLHRAPHRPVLPLHQAPERRRRSTSWSSSRSCPCRRATADAARVVPRRELRSRPVRASCSRSRCRRARTCAGPVAGEQRHHPHRGDLAGDHAAQPAGLAGDPGQPAADPGRQLDHLRAAVLRPGPQRRAATRSSSSWSSTPRSYGAVCAPDGATRASTSCSAAGSRAARATSSWTAPRSTAPTAPAHDDHDTGTTTTTPAPRPPPRSRRPARRCSSSSTRPAARFEQADAALARATSASTSDW